MVESFDSARILPQGVRRFGYGQPAEQSQEQYVALVGRQLGEHVPDALVGDESQRFLFDIASGWIICAQGFNGSPCESSDARRQVGDAQP
jgi:hypothetical protein